MSQTYDVPSWAVVEVMRRAEQRRLAAEARAEARADALRRGFGALLVQRAQASRLRGLVARVDAGETVAPTRKGREGAAARAPASAFNGPDNGNGGVSAEAGNFSRASSAQETR